MTWLHRTIDRATAYRIGQATPARTYAQGEIARPGLTML